MSRTGFMLAVLCAFAAGASRADGTDDTDGSAWQYRLTPYLWIATLTGDLAAGGAEGSTDSDYSFWALENLEGYGSAHFEARAATWGWFVDALYVSYEDSFDGALLDTALGVSGLIYEGGATYALPAKPRLALLAGVRVIDLEVDVSLDPGPSGSGEDSWADPFVGVRYNRPFGKNWYLDLRGDLGGFGVSSDLQTQVVASVVYRFGEHLEAFGGYRYLHADFESDILLDATAAGPGLGFTWTW